MFCDTTGVGLFGENLYRLVKFERRETVRGFADKAGIAVSTMTRLREMDSPDEMYPATLQQVIAALGWTVPEFNDWWKVIQRTSASEVPDQNLSLHRESLHEIPEWELHVAAGDWIESCINGKLDTDDPKQAAVLKQGLFRIKIRGDSMLPKFQDGDTIEFKVFRHGDEGDSIQIGKPYYVHRSDGTCTFKVLESMDDETAVLRALNTKKYPKAMIVPVQEIVRMARAVKLVVDLG